jgi:DNA-binding PadR family transcriptional regulator
MERSLRRFWPRAASKLYEEPKKLADLGLARATQESVGRRPRTSYAATAEGRRELARWLSGPCAVPVLESEALLKVFFAEHGTKEDLLATLENLRGWAEGNLREDARIASSYVAGTGPFPARAAQLALVGRYLADFADMTLQWSQWATAVVSEWPDDISQAPAAKDTLRDIANRTQRLTPQ